MKFGELKTGDTIYCIMVKNSEIVDSQIKTKIVADVYKYKDTNSIEVHLSDDTMIIPGQEEEYVIRGLGTMTNILEPFNFTIYATSQSGCQKVIEKLVSTKITQLSEDYKKINVQMARLCLMSSVAREIESKSSVVLEPVYTD